MNNRFIIFIFVLMLGDTKSFCFITDVVNDVYDRVHNMLCCFSDISCVAYMTACDNED